MTSTKRTRIMNDKRDPIVLCEMKVHGLKQPLLPGQAIYQIYHPQMTNYVIRLTKNINGFYEVSCDWNIVGVFSKRHDGQLALRVVMKDAMKGKYSLPPPLSDDKEMFMFDEEDQQALYLTRLSLTEPSIDHFAEE